MSHAKFIQLRAVGRKGDVVRYELSGPGVPAWGLGSSILRADFTLW